MVGGAEGEVAAICCCFALCWLLVLGSWLLVLGWWSLVVAVMDDRGIGRWKIVRVRFTITKLFPKRLGFRRMGRISCP